jgi:DNA-binding transcriptional ArsR family regulator
LCYSLLDLALEETMSADPAPDLDLVLRALADGNRRGILAAIRARPRPVGELADEVGLSQQAASHHLRVLNAAGLARGTRAGTRHLFSVNTDGLAAVRSYLDGFWPDRLAALKTAVEADAAGDTGRSDVLG